MSWSSCRIAPLADGIGGLAAPVRDASVERRLPRVITDGWQGYSGLDGSATFHGRRSQRAARSRGEDTGKLFAAHQVKLTPKRWLLGTHQGSAEETHLASYLNEFVFRFNRRREASGDGVLPVLELAVADHTCPDELLVPHGSAVDLRTEQGGAAGFDPAESGNAASSVPGPVHRPGLASVMAMPVYSGQNFWSPPDFASLSER